MLIWTSILLCALQIPVESTAQTPLAPASKTLIIPDATAISGLLIIPDTLTIPEILPISNLLTIADTPAIPDTLTTRAIPSAMACPGPMCPDTLYRRATLAIKTNLLFYGVYMPGYDRWCPMPNVALEYYPKKGHFTFGASFDSPWWRDYDAHKYFQVRQYQVESRYYLRGRKAQKAQAHKTHRPHEAHEAHEAYEPYEPYEPPFTGFYLQAYANGGVFGICFDANRGWVGEGIGGGLGLGYVLPLTRTGHWKLEFNLQAGYFRCKYDPYQYENPVDPSYHDDLYYYKWTLSPSLFKKRQYRWNWIGPTRIGITLSYDLLYKRIQKKGVSFKAHEAHKAYRPHEAHKANKANRPYKPHEPHWPHSPQTPERRPAP